MNPILYRYKDTESVIKVMDGYTPGEGWEPLYSQDQISSAVNAALKATAPDERVKELEAELAAAEIAIAEYRQQCLDNAAEIARLRKLIADHVNSSNNDDSAGDTFGALMAEVQPKHKPKPFIGTRSAIYKCTDCGHEQSVQEIHTEYGVYVGSGANWCDKCGGGKPERKETP
jgi:uncharacterized coiled-coil protein SlyX